MSFHPSMAAFLACAMVFTSNMAMAQDDSLRQRLKNRLAQRQQAKADAANVSINQAGDHRFTLAHDGLMRLYRIHVPASYTPQTPAPLLVALHGGGGNMDYQADDSKYGLITKSEQAGFVVVFPNGYSRFENGKLATWNAGNCCGAARDAQVDDTGFIRAVVAQVTTRMNIDRKRIFATGMSNGAMMSYRLACEMADVFTAIAAVAGTDNTRQCQPSRPVSVLHIHAKNDTHVLFEGGAGPDSVNKSAVTDYVSVADTVSKWGKLNGCNASAQRTLNKPGATCDVVAPCLGGTQLELCVTQSGGHSWPGGQKSRGDEAPSQAISANDVMWDFFSRQTLPASGSAPRH
ncbi:MAG: polyhydroxybutyrate depolymerase [Comamonadaceae bacterium]|nr:MAG: polyhydroxybutyrate depolymerase [Comamonadaceae bacterium]